jgi:hypothetical protein
VVRLWYAKTLAGIILSQTTPDKYLSIMLDSTTG